MKFCPSFQPFEENRRFLAYKHTLMLFVGTVYRSLLRLTFLSRFSLSNTYEQQVI